MGSAHAPTRHTSLIIMQALDPVSSSFPVFFPTVIVKGIDKETHIKTLSSVTHSHVVSTPEMSRDRIFTTKAYISQAF